MQLQQHEVAPTLQILLPSKADLLRHYTVLWQWQITSTAWAKLTAAMQGELQGLAFRHAFQQNKSKVGLATRKRKDFILG